MLLDLLLFFFYNCNREVVLLLEVFLDLLLTDWLLDLRLVEPFRWVLKVAHQVADGFLEVVSLVEDDWALNLLLELFVLITDVIKLKGLLIQDSAIVVIKQG